MANPWVTVAEAAHAHGKSVETIRRWARDYPDHLRSKILGGITHLHKDDLTALAAAHPAPDPQRKPCTREGHLPVGDDGAWEAGELTTVRDASGIAHRSKTAILRWAAQDAVRSLSCRCGGRTYIYAADLEAACKRFDRNRKRPTQ